MTCCLSNVRILGSACMMGVRTADNRDGQLAVTFFVSFGGSVLDVNTAITTLEVASYTFFTIKCTLVSMLNTLPTGRDSKW